MNIRVRLFSVVRDIAGFDEQTVIVPPRADAAAVFRKLVETHPRLEPWNGSVRMAVNYEYVPSTHPLKEGDELAIIPPVSGG